MRGNLPASAVCSGRKDRKYDARRTEPQHGAAGSIQDDTKSGERAGCGAVRTDGKRTQTHRTGRYPAAVRPSHSECGAGRAARDRGEPAPRRRSVHLRTVLRRAAERHSGRLRGRVRQRGFPHRQHARGQRPAARLRRLPGRGSGGRRGAVRRGNLHRGPGRASLCGLQRGLTDRTCG